MKLIIAFFAYPTLMNFYVCVSTVGFLMAFLYVVLIIPTYSPSHPHGPCQVSLLALSDRPLPPYPFI